MAESDVTYTAEELAAMQSALNRAANEHDPKTVLQDLEAYYQVQTPVRGYAELALQVLENKGLGIVANQEVRDAVGKGKYTPSYRANLARLLAEQDYRQIISNHDFVPTLKEDAEDHYLVFHQLHLPITAWGGTAFTALGDDFTEGVATKPELKDITPPDFARLTPSQIQDAINNLFVAGLKSSPELSAWQDLMGFFSLQGLHDQLGDKEPSNRGDNPFHLENDVWPDFGFGETAIRYLDKDVTGENASNRRAEAVPGAMRLYDRMSAIWEEILAAEHEKARTSPVGGASANAPANHRPGRSAQAIPESLKPDAQTVALAAALYKAIHKEVPAPAAQGALAHRNGGPTGRRVDPIIIHHNGNMRSTRTMN
jgi:hypothetical protein